MRPTFLRLSGFAAYARVTAIVAAAVTLVAFDGCGEAERVDPPRLPARTASLAADPYWVGRSFAGLPLTAVSQSQPGLSLIYGTCDPGPGDGGCSTPLQIQVTSICVRNAALGDLRPRTTRHVRGAVVRAYGERGEDHAELAVGDTNVTVFASSRLRDRVLAALRPVEARSPRARLPRARYPRAYVAELRRVRDTHLRLGSIRAVRNTLGISQSAVRFRLALARELGSRRLRRPAAQFTSNGRCAIEP